MALKSHQGVSRGVPTCCWEEAGMQKRPGLEGEVVAPHGLGFACLCVQQTVLHSDKCLNLYVVSSIYFHRHCAVIY